MSYRFVLTAFGKDRVGFVADVTRLLYENDCNLEDTTMNLLEDEFTISLLFSSGETAVVETLDKACRRLEMERGISAFIRQLPELDPPKTNGNCCTLHIEGHDQSGIVFKTSNFLADQGVNILTLNSTSTPSPQSGAPIYSMNIKVQLPATFSVAALEEGLGQVADDLQVDISVSN